MALYSIGEIATILNPVTSSTEMDRYGHFTEAMQQASATRMENFIKEVMKL